MRNLHEPLVLCAKQQFRQSVCILDRMTIAVVVEICPNSSGTTLTDALGPDPQFSVAVVMAVPLAEPMKAYVDIIGSLHELVGQAGAAAGAKDSPRFLKSAENLVVPPTLVAEFHNVSTARIKLI